MPRSLYRDGRIRIVQSKTGAEVNLPVDMVAHLSQRLAAEIARQAARPVQALTLIVSEKTCRPYSVEGFSHLFARIRATAVEHLEAAGRQDLAKGIAQLEFRHLRHTAVTRLDEAGCSIAEIRAITGHSLVSCTSILERYSVRTGTLADNAFAKRLKNEGQTL